MRIDVNHSLALHLIQLPVITELVKSAPNCQCDSKTVNIDQVTMYLQVALISILNVKVGNIGLKLSVNI